MTLAPDLIVAPGEDGPVGVFTVVSAASAWSTGSLALATHGA
ncbi:MAG: hypothetical protein ACRDYA_21620 [Egibacteraceae bacterium]